MKFDRFDAAIRLIICFPSGFINRLGEFIPFKETPSVYFKLITCESEWDVKAKVLNWLSRSAAKAMPFRSKKKNEEFQKKALDGINAFLGTYFTKDDIEVIYTRLGNGVNQGLTIKFIEHGYPMGLLRREEPQEKEVSQ